MTMEMMNIMREVERIRSNYEINGEMIAGEHISDGAATSTS